MSTASTTTAAVIETEDVLQTKLGYKSTLRRGITFEASICANFNAVAILMGIAVVYGDALATGGPVVIVWGFLLAFAMTVVVSFCMAELCAAYPAAGGVYYWSAQTVPEQNAPAMSYFTAWSSLFGGVANVAISALVFAELLNATIIISNGPEFAISRPGQAAISFVCMLVWAALNTARIDEVTSIGIVIGILNVFTIIVIFISCLGVPAKLQSSYDVLFSSYDETGFPSQAYLCFVGIVLPAYCFAGYDAAAQLAEETHNPRQTAPLGILIANIFGGFAGFLVFVSLIAASVDIRAVIHGRTDFAIVNVFDLYMNPSWACTLAALLTIEVFLQGPGAIAAASRTVFALARDNGLPFPSLLAKVDPTFKSPIYAIIAGTAMGSLLLLFATDPNQEQMLESLINSAVCGMQISYAMPLVGNLFYGRTIPASPFSLGSWSRTLSFIACCWLIAVSIITFLPNEYPVTLYSMNWAIVSTFGFYLICYLNWEFNSKYTFKGPRIYGKRYSLSDRNKPSPETTVSPMQQQTGVELPLSCHYKHTR